MVTGNLQMLLIVVLVVLVSARDVVRPLRVATIIYARNTGRSSSLHALMRRMRLIRIFHHRRELKRNRKIGRSRG